MVRVVAFADTHQFHDELQVPDGDVLLCVGDVCRGGEREELEIFLAWFSAFPHKTKLFVAGNHDGCLETELAEVRAAHPHIRFLQDEGVDVDGVSFWGSPWTPNYNDWFFMKTRGAALRERWALIPHGLDVLVTHGPPKGMFDDVGRYRPVGNASDDLGNDERFVGCADLMARVQIVRPRVHLFGHIHTTKGDVDVDGIRFINCTTFECELPCAVVDLSTRLRG
ncbi:MAG: metallophosphatase domain-containing protein [Deltaproteobacteria bacterium]|nr:metallophosphatase domain-containing protein [Deltaproteobacteria bacterium]